MAGRLDASVLALDCASEIDRIALRTRELVGGELHRRGAVVALSGGVDSSVCVGLAVKAFGPERVIVLLLPERESSGASLSLGRQVAAHFGVKPLLHDITPALEGLGAYRERDEAMRQVIPSYGPDWKSKLVIAGGSQGGMNFFKLIAKSPDGQTHEARIPLKPYLQIVAAQNYKQRMRKTVEYYHADRANYAVIGTPNRLEYDQGFFVKNGDGAADVKPIAHLYKSQVYALARHFGLPEEICGGRPTTDTYTLPQGQDEFYFALPYEKMDLALWALNNDRPAEELAAAIGVTTEQAHNVYRDIQTKRTTTRALHSRPLLIDPVPQVHPL
jgi:NAD+ synthase